MRPLHRKDLYTTYNIWTITFEKSKYKINSIITYTRTVEPGVVQRVNN